LIIGIALLRTGDLTEIAISVIGLLTPFLIALGLYYVTGKEMESLLTTLVNNLFSKSSGYHLPVLTVVSLIIECIILLVCIAYLVKLMSTKKIKSRKTFSLLLWVFLISAGIYIVLPSVSIEIIWLISIPGSYFMTHYFVFKKKKLVPEIFFSVLFVLVLLIQISNLK
jgi:hypothetical protein